MRSKRPFRLLALALLLGACESPSDPELKTLTIAPGARSVEVGASVQLAVVAKDQGGDPIEPGPVTWSVNDTAVATITSDGMLTARKLGEVLATAEAAGKSHVVRIAVVTAAAHSVDIGQDSLIASSGTQVKLNVQIRDARGAPTTGSVVTITTSNADVASLGSLNVPLRVGTQGTAVVTIVVDGVRDSVIVRATVATVARMLLPNATTISAGEAMGLDVIPLSALGEILDNNVVTWTSSDTSIATVTAALGGVASHSASVVAKRIGFVRMTARSGDVAQSIDVDVRPGGPRKWKQVVVGNTLVCALNEDGAAFCAGRNTHGQTGNGSVTPFNGSYPTLSLLAVKAPWRYVELSAAYNAVCGRTIEGYAVCWGAGSQTASGYVVGAGTPHIIDETLRFAKVRSGFNGACGVTAGGSVYCWNQPLPGNPATIAPSRVAIADVVTDFAMAHGTMCYTTTDGTVKCLGAVASTPEVSMRFSTISAGDVGFCGLSDGVTYCWGNINTFRPVGFPEPVVTSAAVNDQDVCSIAAGGTGYCVTYETGVTRTLSGARAYTQLAAGFRDVCAMSTDDVYCWNYTFVHPDRLPSETTPPVLMPRQPTR